MSATTTTGIDIRVATEITEQKALAQAEIAELRAKIADPSTRISYLDSLTADLQREVAYLAQLEFVESQIRSLVREDNPQLGLLAQLHYLATEACYLTANGKRESKEVVEGRANALRVVTGAVYYALYDQIRASK